MTPGATETLVHEGHTVLIQAGAGNGSGFTDKEYVDAGAELINTAPELFSQVDIIVKVKEPQPNECEMMKDGQILYTYLHLASDEQLTYALIERNITAVAYETVELDDGSLPLLTPMSEVAGRMSVQVAAHYLEKASGGRGKLLGGVPGVRPATVTIIGGGIVGINAAKIALGMGAQVLLVDINPDRLRYLDDVLHGNVTTLSSNRRNIGDAVMISDIVIGAVLIAGARAPLLVTKEMVSSMTHGSVIVDVAVDQGGCIETIIPTTHSKPVYELDGILHYGVTNMPGAVPRTSTYALTSATLPYTVRLASQGFEDTVRSDRVLASGVNVYRGQITHPAVAETYGLEYTPLPDLL
tara:strand:- start:3740 stop:4801 length:1062 start_codon:yes stop_codon:yes gene_type:complete